MNLMHRIRVLAQVATVGVLAFAAIVVLEHLLVPRLGPVDHMVSEYANAGGAVGVIAVIALLVWSVSLVAAALLTGGAAAPAGGRERRPLRVIAACLCFAGLGLALAAVFPTQAVRGVVPPGVARTPAGRLHDLGSGVAQAAVFVAALLSLRAVPWSRRLRLVIAGAVVAALILGPTLAAFDAGARGLRQRALIGAACVWELALVSTLGRPDRQGR